MTMNVKQRLAARPRRLSLRGSCEANHPFVIPVIAAINSGFATGRKHIAVLGLWESPF